MKVFISSTRVDLIDHRKAARDALAKLGLHVIRMEDFGAQPKDVTTACLEGVEESDLFVGIYAHRYGHIPKDSEVSITQQEFIHAEKLKKPIFGFIVDEDHGWPPKHIEHKKKAKLKAFMNTVKKQPVDFFTTPDNLAKNIASSVGKHLDKQKTNPGSTISAPEPCKPTGSTLPHQPFFFGRAKELAVIAEAVAPESRTWGALIDGPGGIGKTALAIKAAHDAPATLFERKIFITAKVRELTPEGERPLKDFSRDNYFSLLNELALELGEEGIPRLAPDERANQLRMAMVGKKILVVFDNLETLGEGERIRLFQFLTRLPEGNKAIVTSRRRTDVDARIVRLDRLAHDEAMLLVDELAAHSPRLKRATQKERDALYENTEGNPLVIRWIIGQLGREGSHCRTIADACSFLEKASKGNDPLEYIFGDLLETFTESETKVLAALTHFTRPAKLSWIAQMTALPERAAETALEDLTDRSILISNTESRTFYLPPLAAQFIKTRRPEAVAKTGNALSDRAYALAMQYGGNKNYEGFKTLDAEWELLAAALPRLLQGDNDRLQTVCNKLDKFFDFTGRWDEWLWLSEQAEARALAAGDKDKAGWRAYLAGWVYQFRNQPAEVIAYAARAAAHWENGSPLQKATAIQLHGLGHDLQKDYPAAIASYREALEIQRAISPESGNVGSALNCLANTERDSKDYTAAERDLREALRIAKKVDNQEGVATYTYNLALLAFCREQWAEAESLAREALALGEKVGRHELIARACHLIAYALLKQNRAAEAQPFASRAVEIFARLRCHELPKAQKMLAEIEQANCSSGLQP